ncbi:FHA domain-containing protein [Streptomyces sp. NPDC046985]|uniref:FHA domain-containing protein n=1 Tax=Streptomyces sp. NPDC046985 TaxID=3155377 RepID=UPI0033D63A0C
MQIRLTVVDPSAPPADLGRAASCDVLVTAPSGTALAAVAPALAAAVSGDGAAAQDRTGRERGAAERGGREPGAGPVVLYAGAERLDAQRCTLGEPPLLDGAVLCLGGPAEPEAHPELDEAPARLHVVAGPDAGGVHLLHGGQLTVGRSADADVPLDDPDVSRVHCTVTVAADGRVSVADPGSTNGTALDGRPVGPRPVPLPPGALLRIGESALRLTPAAGPAARVATAPDGEGHVRVPGGSAGANAHAPAPARTAGGSDARPSVEPTAAGGAGAVRGTGTGFGEGTSSGGGSAHAEGSAHARGSAYDADAADGTGAARDTGTGTGFGGETSSGGGSAHAWRSTHGAGAADDVATAYGAGAAGAVGVGGAGAAGARPATGDWQREEHGGHGAHSEDRAHGPHGGSGAHGSAEPQVPAQGRAPGAESRPGALGGDLEGDYGPGVRRRAGLGAWARRLAGGRGAAAEAEASGGAYDGTAAGASARELPAAYPAELPPETWPDPAALLLTALGPGPLLWERGPGHPETLAVRLGTADRPAPDGSGRLLPAVPVTAGLREAGALGLAGPRARLTGLARAVLAQLAALHSPDTLEIVLLCTDRTRPLPERTAEWSWLGWLPHVRPGHGQDCRLLLAYDRDQAAARTGELLRRLDDCLADARRAPGAPDGGRSASVPRQATASAAHAQAAADPYGAPSRDGASAYGSPSDGHGSASPGASQAHNAPSRDASAAHGAPSRDADATHSAPSWDTRGAAAPDDAYGAPSHDVGPAHRPPFRDAADTHGSLSWDAADAPGSPVRNPTDAPGSAARTFSDASGAAARNSAEAHRAPSPDAFDAHGRPVGAPQSAPHPDAAAADDRAQAAPHGDPAGARGARPDAPASPGPDAPAASASAPPGGQRPAPVRGAARRPSWAQPGDGQDSPAGPEGHDFAGPYTVLVVDGDPGDASVREAVARLAQEGPRAGIHVVCLAETAPASPASPVAETYEEACAASPVFRRCGAVALLSGDVATALRLMRVVHSGARAQDPVGPGAVAVVDAVSAQWAERFARAMAPLRSAADPSGGGRPARVSAPLPPSARLLDELGLARATPASLQARWADAADDAAALGGRAWAVLGAGPRGPVCADLAADGPHLLIEGPAGSGRTELLRSAVASLAAAERPDRLGIVLLDGRDSVGGGHGEGLRVCTDVPHVTTHLIANDPVRMREFAQSLSAELKRRGELLGRDDFAAWHTRRALSGRIVSQRTASGRAPAPGQGHAPAGAGAEAPAGAGAADLDASPSSTLRLRLPAARAQDETPPALPRLVVVVDDLDALVSPALGSPGRPAAGSVMRALEAVARDGGRLGVHLVAAAAPGGRTAQTEPGRRAALRVVLDAPASGRGGASAAGTAEPGGEPAPGRGRLTGPDGGVTPFQGGRVTGRIPRTATQRPTVVPLEWQRMGDPPARRSVRELGNGPTDLALLASALQRAAREVSAAEVPSLL